MTPAEFDNPLFVSSGVRRAAEKIGLRILTADDIAMLDRALFASVEFLGEVEPAHTVFGGGE